MNNLQDLYAKRTKLYKKLQTNEQKLQALIKKTRLERADISSQIEDIKDQIADIRGRVMLERERDYGYTRIDVNDLKRWLTSTYAGSEALALVAGTQVRKDYENYQGMHVKASVFNRAMESLGFESKSVRVASGGGYVTRAWVRRRE